MLTQQNKKIMMKKITLLLIGLIQLAFAVDWKIESIVSKPIINSTKLEALEITIKIKNISKESQSVSQSPYKGKGDNLSPQSFLFKKDESLKELMERNPSSHYNQFNSLSCHPFKLITIAPNQIVEMRMFDSSENTGQKLALFISSANFTSHIFVGEMVIPEITKNK